MSEIGLMSPPTMRLPRGTCPVCGREVALRNGDLVREHVPVAQTITDQSRMELITTAFGKCRGSGLAPDTQTCRRCGCSHFDPCEEGCWWVAEDLCSSCEAAR